MTSRNKTLTLLIGTIFIIYIPFFLRPEIILQRGNDLQEFFLPLIYYIKSELLNGSGFPFWNKMFFSGTPLFPDPQNIFSYPLHIIFLILPINAGIISTFLIHSIIGALGMFALLRLNKASQSVSFVVTILYIISPRLVSAVEAGHLGLIESWAFIPWVYWSTLKLTGNYSVKYALFLSASLFFVFTSHILIFIILAFSNITLFIYNLKPKKNLKNKLLMFGLNHLILLVIMSPLLLPQIDWQKTTTRNLLLQNPETYPMWLNKKEFLTSIFVPSRDTEKSITIGLLVVYLSLWGFKDISFKNKISTLALFLFIMLIASNNVSPIYNFLLKQNWFVLFRVSTRLFFPITVLFLLLAAKGLDYLNKKSRLYLAIGMLAIVETIIFDRYILTKPFNTNYSSPLGVIEYIKKDPDLFRVFCLNRCIKQMDAAIHDIELIEGYGTLQQQNYYEYSQQIAQSFWRNTYTLSLPPFQNYLYERLKPFPPSLAEYRVKYVISPYEITIKNLELKNQIDKYFIYQNLLYKNPNYLTYSPNYIRVKVDAGKSFVTIPEVYNSNWKAYLNGKSEVKVDETPDKTRSVKIDENTSFVDFRYEPYAFLKNVIPFLQ